MGDRARRGRGLLLSCVAIGLGVAGSLAAGSGAKSDSKAVSSPSDLAVTQENPGRPGEPAAYQADNPKNNLHLSFGSSGVRITPRSPDAGSWSLDLSLSSFGHDADATPPGTARLSASENRVDYSFEGVRQSFVNDEAALEHGFTLAAPPDGRDPDSETKITLDLAVGGDLVPKRVPPSYFVDFADSDDRTVLRYGPVRATGADGSILETKVKILPATDETGPVVRVSVEAENPVYPILIQAALSPAASTSAKPMPGPGPEPEPEAGTGERVGVPVTLERGITETVGEIMAREHAAAQRPFSKPRETHHELEFEQDRLENPDATAASHWPPSNTFESAPAAPLIGPPDLPQSLGLSFKGVGVAQSGYIPPDSMGDVGPTQIVVHVNGRIRSFNKAGLADGALDSNDVIFWTSVAGSGGISDPEVRYDRVSGRWFILGITVAEVVNNKIVLAVSSGPNITNQSSFTFYSFNVGTPAPSDALSFCDYPSLGVDANALYTGCNMFASTGSFRWTSGFVIRKSSVLSGGPMVVTGFANLTGGCAVTTACSSAPCNVNAGLYAPRGVDNDDPQATEGYFVGSDICFLSRLEFRRVTNPGGNPTLSANIALNTLTTTNNSPQQASGSTTAVDPSDSRLFTASIRKNKLTGVSSLWTAHTVETTTACVGASSGGTRRLGARWYEIGNLTTTPTATQTGTLCTTTAGANSLNSQRGFLYPSVTQTGQGHMALGASFASASEFVGVASAGRLRTDPAAGTRAPETVVLNGSASYTINDPGGRNRWGDYSFTDVDPNDDQTVWTFQEYADTPANNWSVRVVQLLAPPPPALATATPVCQGLSSTTTTITGTENCAAPSCANGLCSSGGPCPEFFDPGADTGGPGFANHITATVTGGVTVNPYPATNIVIPGSPSTSRVLQATLSLNTTAAAAGTQNITITNPDGQSTTGVAILTVNPTPVQPTASNGGPICAGATLQLNTPTVPGATYSWTGPNGFTSSAQNPSIPSATAAATGTYNVTVTLGGCSSLAGSTSATVVATGGSCTDNSLCTTGDVCQAGGACSGAPVNCTPSDSCHDAGTCDSGTGICSNPAKADGATCSDGNSCTQTDTCQAGVCTGANPVVCSPSDSCHDAGVCDSGTGICSNPAKPDGVTCSDGNACTQTDTCQTGVCTGANPVVCSASDQCHDAGVCDTGSGLCSNPAKPDGSTCSDANACTQTDTCQTGVCTGANPVVCSASDQCHDAGVCDTGSGLCSNPAKPDGSTCSDANACTQTDTCQTGVCTGANPVVCSASDQCHDAGVCDTGSGLCSNPAKPDGSTCSDANACTQTDSCQLGACVGANPVICSASDQCHDAGLCDTGSGVCSNPPRPDGSSCDDGNACTMADSCQAGSCLAGPPTDLDGDAHVNGLCGGDDCNDANPLVWGAPSEATNLILTTTSPADPTWDSQAALAGPETTYDLVSGDFGPTGGISFSLAACLQSSGPSSFSDARPDPAVSLGFWYLSRARNSCGVGTYGSAPRDTGIPACP